MERQEKLQQFIEDAAAYIRYGLSKGKSNAEMLAKLSMDIGALERQNGDGQLQVDGCAMREQEVG